MYCSLFIHKLSYTIHRILFCFISKYSLCRYAWFRSVKIVRVIISWCAAAAIPSLVLVPRAGHDAAGRRQCLGRPLSLSTLKLSWQHGGRVRNPRSGKAYKLTLKCRRKSWLTRDFLWSLMIRDEHEHMKRNGDRTLAKQAKMAPRARQASTAFWDVLAFLRLPRGSGSEPTLGRENLVAVFTTSRKQVEIHVQGDHERAKRKKKNGRKRQRRRRRKGKEEE